MEFNPIGFAGSLLSGIFGGAKKKKEAAAAAARAEELRARQEENRRLFEERMLAMQAQQKPAAGLQISPLIMIMGVAVVGMIFIPQMMKR